MESKNKKQSLLLYFWTFQVKKNQYILADWSRSMFARLRYHAPCGWAGNSGDDVRWAVRTLAQALGAEGRRHDWRDPRWRSRRQRKWVRRSHPRWSDCPPGRPFPRMPEMPRWSPSLNGYEPREGKWSRYPGRPVPRGWNDRAFPRRGKPVAVVEAPRWPRQEAWCERRPRGFEPRGPLRGGPERPADDPQRKPRGGQCGGPTRSASDTQTPHKTAHAKTNGGDGGNEGSEKPRRSQRPTIVTVDEKGSERRWGPLSRTTARRVGRFWEDMTGKVDVFLEKDRKREKS